MHLQRMPPGTVARDGDFETSPYNPNVSEQHVIWVGPDFNGRTDTLGGLVRASIGLVYPRTSCRNVLYRPVSCYRDMLYEAGYDYFLPSRASEYIVAAGDQCTDGDGRWRDTNRLPGSAGNVSRVYRRRVTIPTIPAPRVPQSAAPSAPPAQTLPVATVAVLTQLRQDVIGLMGDGHSDEQIGQRVLRALDSLLVGYPVPEES